VPAVLERPVVDGAELEDRQPVSQALLAERLTGKVESDTRTRRNFDLEPHRVVAQVE